MKKYLLINIFLNIKPKNLTKKQIKFLCKHKDIRKKYYNCMLRGGVSPEPPEPLEQVSPEPPEPLEQVSPEPLTDLIIEICDTYSDATYSTITLQLINTLNTNIDDFDLNSFCDILFTN